MGSGSGTGRKIIASTPVCERRCTTRVGESEESTHCYSPLRVTATLFPGCALRCWRGAGIAAARSQMRKLMASHSFCLPHLNARLLRATCCMDGDKSETENISSGGNTNPFTHSPVLPLPFLYHNTRSSLSAPSRRTLTSDWPCDLPLPALRTLRLRSISTPHSLTPDDPAATGAAAAVAAAATEAHAAPPPWGAADLPVLPSFLTAASLPALHRLCLVDVACKPGDMTYAHCSTRCSVAQALRALIRAGLGAQLRELALVGSGMGPALLVPLIAGTWDSGATAVRRVSSGHTGADVRGDTSPADLVAAHFTRLQRLVLDVSADFDANVEVVLPDNGDSLPGTTVPVSGSCFVPLDGARCAAARRAVCSLLARCPCLRVLVLTGLPGPGFTLLTPGCAPVHPRLSVAPAASAVRTAPAEAAVAGVSQAGDRATGSTSTTRPATCRPVPPPPAHAPRPPQPASPPALPTASPRAYLKAKGGVAALPMIYDVDLTTTPASIASGGESKTRGVSTPVVAPPRVARFFRCYRTVRQLFSETQTYVALCADRTVGPMDEVLRSIPLKGTQFVAPSCTSNESVL